MGSWRYPDGLVMLGVAAYLVLITLVPLAVVNALILTASVAFGYAPLTEGLAVQILASGALSALAGTLAGVVGGWVDEL